MRLKLRQSQSTLPIEKVSSETEFLELLAPSLEKLPSLVHLYRLKSLYLSLPELTQLSLLPETIEILKIRFTHLKKDDLLKIQKLSKIKTLELIETKILDLPESFFDKLLNLENLTLKGNQLESLPSGLIKCKKLTRVNLDNNQLTHLPDTIIKSTQINHLSLDHNLFDEKEKSRIFKMYGIWF